MPLDMAPAPSALPPRSRARPMDDFLLGDPITTPEQLGTALDQQSRMPMVRIGEALVGLGFITEEKLAEALQLQSRDRSLPLGELLVMNGDVTRSNLQSALARKMGYPIVDVATFPVEPDAALRLPISTARRLPALPLMARAGSLAPAIERVYMRLGKDGIEPSAELSLSLNLDVDNPDSANKLLASLEQQQAPSESIDETPIEQSDNSLVRLINTMIMEAKQQGVSDIHIE
ncbi:MAG: pilus assembly protein PilB, partial [Burkholderiales bacterium PBB5]